MMEIEFTSKHNGIINFQWGRADFYTGTRVATAGDLGAQGW
jgi:hypothetical protein